MVDTGDAAPEFTAPLATGEIETFDLSEALDDGPVVLAYFPGSFTSVCSHEMNAFQDRLDELEDLGVTLVGISRDTPFTHNEFREKLGLEFGLVSDLNREIIDEYGIAMDFTDLGVEGVAKRSVFVVDEDGTVSYSSISDDPGVEPEYDEVIEAAADAAE